MRVYLFFIIISYSLFSQGRIKYTEPKDFANAIFQSFEKSDSLDIIKFKPTVDKFRRIIPIETAELSDEKIYENYIKDIKIFEDYNRIIESAKKGNLDWKKFKIIDVEIKDRFGTNKPVSFNILYQYADKEPDKVYCYALFFEGEWFLIGFQHSWDIFEKIRNL